MGALPPAQGGAPTGGTTGQVLKKNSNTDFDYVWGTGGTPGGSDTQVQFNDGGAFGGDADLTWNKTTNILTLGGSTASMPSIVAGGSDSDVALSIRPKGLGFLRVGPDTYGLAGWSGYDLGIEFRQLVAPTAYSYGIYIENNAADVNAAWATGIGSITGNQSSGTHGNAYIAGGLFEAINSLPSSTTDRVVGVDSGAFNNGTGTVTDLLGTYNYVNAYNGPVTNVYGTRSDIVVNTGQTITNAIGFAAFEYGSGNVTNLTGFEFGPVTPASTINQIVGVGIGDLVGKATHSYPFYYGGTGTGAGVFYLDDKGAMAYHNPSFGAYDLTNYERVLQRWNSNTLEYGTQAGGTGTLRPVKITGASLNVPTLSITGLGSGIVKSTSDTLGLATSDVDFTANAFKTIAVSGQSNVVADSAADTLTLAAGSNITLTTNASTDTVTIAATAPPAATPAGSNTNIQYNDSGAFGGDAGLTWNKTSFALTVTGNQNGATDVLVSNNNAGASAQAIGQYYNGTTLLQVGVLGTSASGTFPNYGAYVPYVYGNYGLRLGSAQNVEFSPGGTVGVTANIDGNGWFNTLAGGRYGWNADTALMRNAAGIVEVNNGTTGQYRDLIARHINATSGFQINGVATSGKMLQGNGTDYVGSTPTWPTSASTTGAVIADGSNFVVETPSSTTVSKDTGGWKEYQVSGSNATRTAQTLADVTGLVTDTLSVSSTYEFEATMMVASSSTAGNQYGVNVTVAPTRIVAICSASTSATAATIVSTNANNTAMTAQSTVAADGYANISGYFTTAGTGSPVFSIQYLKVTSGTATVYIGSTLRIRKK